MSLKHGDLYNTMLKKISIDEFEPKTGNINDVIVIAFSVIDQSVGKDLYRFINRGMVDVRDVEVSPNPNPDNYYMVFVELDRNKNTLDNVREIVADVENVAGKLRWQATTHLTDDYIPLNSKKLEQYVIQDPDNYMTREEYEQSQKSQPDQEPELEETILIHEEDTECPKPTQDLELNTKNRDSAIQADHIKYGPLNVDEPGDYWQDIADYWDTTLEAAKSSLCGNCVAFDISPRMLECMPGETSDEDGELGYCWMHHFKCHSARSCRTWAKGGPITEDEVSLDWQSRNPIDESWLNEEIMQFLRNSNLLSAEINENRLTLAGARDSATLTIVDFGDAQQVMKKVGISENAIDQMDQDTRKFNAMLGEMRAVNIGNYVVVFHPEQSRVLVTAPC